MADASVRWVSPLTGTDKLVLHSLGGGGFAQKNKTETTKAVIIVHPMYIQSPLTLQYCVGVVWTCDRAKSVFPSFSAARPNDRQDAHSVPPPHTVKPPIVSLIFPLMSSVWVLDDS